MVYAWVGLMNPHRLSWRMADAPVGLAVALATIAGAFFTNSFRRPPFKMTTVVLLIFLVWTTFTTYEAFAQVDAWVYWNRFAKVLLMCFVSLMLLQERKLLESFLWVCMASVGFYGVKGGIFSLATGGNYRVWGPQGSWIEGNNELAVAELMILPLMLYFLRRATKKWQRLAYWASFFLTMIAILFSYSRGAFLGFAGVASLMILRSRYRLQAALMAIVLVALVLSLAPPSWTGRMFSIGDYQQDTSAMGRINAWHFATNLAKARLIGGGFRTFTRDLFLQYAPDPLDVHDAHSIYFEVIGEQGFPGFFLYMVIMITTLWRLEGLRRRGLKRSGIQWVSELAEMLQFGVIAFAIGGSFLGLAYLDLYFYLVIAALLLELIAGRELAAAAAAPATGPLPAAA
jgi:probable O-glycosylation ligase (exosortase A-associated)